MITKQQALDLKEQYNPDGSDLRILQLKLLDILILFDKFAKQNHITYSLFWGTLLGAVRHDGFIPWDDDADIIITRYEWEKLRKLIKPNGQLEGDLFIGGYARPTLDVVGMGIVDIFILDYSPENIVARKWKLFAARFISLLIKCKERLMRKNFGRKKPWFVLFPLAMCFSLETLKSAWDKVARWYEPKNISDCDWGCMYNNSVQEMYERFPFKYFVEPMTTITFEKYEFPCLSNTDIYLKICYGDYMSLPKHRTNLGRVTDDNFCEIR